MSAAASSSRVVKTATKRVHPRDLKQVNSKYLVVNVPKLYTPNDVLRTFKDAKIVGSEFSLSSITSQPPSIPRRGLIKQYHLSFPSPSSAKETLHRIREFSPFPNLSTLSISSGATRQNNPETSNKREERHRFPTIWQEKEDAKGWVISRTQYFGRGGIDADWSMRPDLKGRRVVLKGVPSMVSLGELRRWVGEGLAQEPNSIRKLPSDQRSHTQIWSLTAESVPRAFDMARRLNQRYFDRAKNGEKFPLKAEVAW